MAAENAEPGRWHQALAYAVLGRRLTDLGCQQVPDVEALAQRLEQERDAAALAGHVRDSRSTGQGWPHPVPADLMAGLGFAQFASALQLLRRRLGLDPAQRAMPRVERPSPMDAGERRLREDVPPHHGS